MNLENFLFIRIFLFACDVLRVRLPKFMDRKKVERGILLDSPHLLGRNTLWPVYIQALFSFMVTSTDSGYRKINMCGFFDN